MAKASEILKQSGPLTLFGGYIQSVSINTAYGVNGGSAQVTIVFPKDGPKRASDFDNMFPPMGTPIGIKLGRLTFGGVLQRYTNKKSISGYTWDVIIESPGKLLEGIQIISDRYQGTNYFGRFPTATNGFFLGNSDGIYNIWNPFGVRENYNYGGLFGDSNVNSLGFPVIDLLTLIEEISRGEHAFGGKAKFGDTFYTVDLSEVIKIVPSFYRIKGPHQSLGNIIQECCDVSSYDFIPMLKPKSGEITSNGIISNPVIKILVNDKRQQPIKNVVRDLVNQHEKSGTLISADSGKEYIQGATQKLVIGGPASRYFVGQQSGMIPVWGRKNPTRFSTVPNVVELLHTGDNYGPNGDAPIPILDSDTSAEFGRVWNASVLEVRCAMSGFDTWVAFHMIAQTGLSRNLFTYVKLDKYTIAGINTGKISVSELIDTSAKSTKVSEEYYRKVRILHESILEAGNENYGKKFLVPLIAEPGGVFNNIKWIPDEFRVILSWDIADSAFWLGRAPYRDISFYDNDGKLKAVAEWPNSANYDFSVLSNNYEYTGRTVATSTVQIEKEIYFYNLWPFALVTVPGVPVDDGFTTDRFGMFYLLKHYGRIADANFSISKLSQPGAEEGPFRYPMESAMAMPQYVGIPQESQRYSWGPWYNKIPGDGAAEVSIEDSLRPETFGSLAALNNVAISAYAYIDNSGIGDSESGYVEVPGLPDYNIVERFAGGGPYVSGIEVSVGTEGITTTYKFNTWTPQLGRLSKFNADRIANINKNSIRFLQEQREKFVKPAIEAKKKTKVKRDGSGNYNMNGMMMMFGQLINRQ